MRREEHAREAVCWGLQASGMSKEDIENNAGQVLQSVQKLAQEEAQNDFSDIAEAMPNARGGLLRRTMRHSQSGAIERTVDNLAHTMNVSDRTRRQSARRRSPAGYNQGQNPYF